MFKFFSYQSRLKRVLIGAICALLMSFGAFVLFIMFVVGPSLSESSCPNPGKAPGSLYVQYDDNATSFQISNTLHQLGLTNFRTIYDPKYAFKASAWGIAESRDIADVKRRVLSHTEFDSVRVNSTNDGKISVSVELKKDVIKKTAEDVFRQEHISMRSYLNTSAELVAVPVGQEKQWIAKLKQTPLVAKVEQETTCDDPKGD